jgi:uncharacterized membrane protein
MKRKGRGMSDKRFLKKEAIGFGWETAKSNIGFFVLFLLVIWVANFIFSAPSGYYWGKFYFWTPILSLLSWVVGIFISMAVIRVILRFNRGETAEFEDLWMGYPKFPEFLVGSILYGLLVFAGFLLLIIPGIYWGVRYQFYGYCIMDRDVGPVEAMKMSGRITRGSWWNLFWLGILQALVVLLGMLACCVGLFWAIPTSMVAHGYAYMKLAAAEPPAMQQPAAAAPVEAPPNTMPPAPPAE